MLTKTCAFSLNMFGIRYRLWDYKYGERQQKLGVGLISDEGSPGCSDSSGRNLSGWVTGSGHKKPREQIRQLFGVTDCCPFGVGVLGSLCTLQATPCGAVFSGTSKQF